MSNNIDIPGIENLAFENAPTYTPPPAGLPGQMAFTPPQMVPQLAPQNIPPPGTAPVAPGQVGPGGLSLGPITAPNPVPPPAYAGAAPPGSLGATPTQATAEGLNIREREKNITGALGEVSADEAKAIAAKNLEDAAEKRQQATDYANLLDAHNAKHELNHKKLQDAYDDYSAKAGKLGDPADTFFKEKGLKAQIGSVFAAFASGMGSGLLGHGGNPFLDYLNGKIHDNYQAHVQNIRDLYERQVAAGKIEDSDDNWNRFSQEGRLHAYDLAAMHIKPELEAIKNGSISRSASLLADQTIAGMDRQSLADRANYSHQQAVLGATGLAQQRAREKEVREFEQKALEKYITVMGIDQARSAAAKDVLDNFGSSPGYSGVVNPILEGAGGTVDPKTGKWNIEVPKPPGGGAPDETGVPTVDPVTGRPLKFEERQKALEEQHKLQVIDIDTGKPRKAVSPEAQKGYQAHSDAWDESQRLTKQLEDAWKSGDEGSYHQARQALIEIYPKLVGFTRGPSGAQAGEGGGDESALKGTVSGQLPEHIQTYRRVPGIKRVGEAVAGAVPFSIFNTDKHIIEGWKAHLQGVHRSMTDSTFGTSAGDQASKDLGKVKIDFTPGAKP